MPAAVRAVAIALVLAGVVAPPAGAQLVISEFRARGPGGAGDEFVELYNPGSIPHTVTAASGYGVAGADGVTRCVVPNGAVVFARGHYLCVNSNGYSLAGYAGGSGLTATGDTTYTNGIADSGGIALFDTSVPADYTLANRMDAVGFSNVAALYREGNGLTPLLAMDNEFSFVRHLLARGTHTDTGDNAKDFDLVSVDPPTAWPAARLGAPGPENSQAPVGGSPAPGLVASLAATCVGEHEAPNTTRTGSILAIRRRLENHTGTNLDVVRFRISDLSGLPAGEGTAVLKVVSAPDSTEANPCGGGTLNIRGLTLEQPPIQARLGGVNSSLRAGSISPANPLVNGGSLIVSFLFDVAQEGETYICAASEALPTAGGLTLAVGRRTTTSSETLSACGDLAPPVSTEAPAVVGGAEVGQTLTTSLGRWDGNRPLAFSYQWERCDASGGGCADIAAGTAAAYTAGADDVGHTLRARVGATNRYGSASALSAVTGVVPVLPSPSPEPSPTPTVAPSASPTPAPTATATPAPDRTAPRLSSLKLSPSRFRALSKGGSVLTRRGGTRVSYKLTEAANVKFTVERRRGSKYRAVTGSFTVSGKTGSNSFRFSGRLRAKRLSAARYRLVARATDAAGNRSGTVRKSFRVR